MHKVSVYMTIPMGVNVGGQKIFRDVVYSSWNILGDQRFHVVGNLPTGFPIEENRNQIMKHFLSTGADFWLSMDTDNPPTRNPLDLCFLDLDLIGFPTPVYRWDKKMSAKEEPPIHWNGYEFVPFQDAYNEMHERHGLTEVDSIGSGCYLMARRVAEHESLSRQAWQRTYDKDGFIDKGSDIAFCERMKRIGFRIWCHYGYPCDHVKSVSLASIYKGYHQAFNKWLRENKDRVCESITTKNGADERPNDDRVRDDERCDCSGSNQ